MDLRKALEDLDLCDMCKIRLQLQLLLQELPEQRSSSALLNNSVISSCSQIIKGFTEEVKKQVLSIENILMVHGDLIKDLQSKLSAPREEKEDERLTYKQLKETYNGNVGYRGKQTKGFIKFLREKGYPEFIHEIKEAKAKYKQYKQTQAAIAENQKEGYALP